MNTYFRKTKSSETNVRFISEDDDFMIFIVTSLGSPISLCH